jgi:hypothetical protein
VKKIVGESLYSFEKKSNPLDSLNVGRRKRIEDWLDEMDVRDYTINDDLSIDVECDVHLESNDLYEFPDYIKFNTVTGCFYCDNNQLTSLVGCPFTCSHFACSFNVLNSLRYCPSYVGGNFRCNDNRLTSLDHCPKQVNGDFHCRNNKKAFSKEYIRSLCDIHTHAHIYI